MFSGHPTMRQMNGIATIRKVDYAAEEMSLRSIRFAVFVDEQGVPPEIEMDERDPHCIHLIAYSGAEPIATARIDIEQAGKVGRLAVLAKYRGHGIGSALMERCHDIAAGHGLTAVWCNAQVSAVPFYESVGYRVEGDPFDEAGIDHLKMTRAV